MNAIGHKSAGVGSELRILFTTSPGMGHLFPMVPLASALRAAGHSVLVATPESFVGEVPTMTALPAIPNSGPVNMGDMMSPGKKMPPVRHKGPGSEHVGRGFARLAAVTLAGTEMIVDRWRPDLIISETSEYAGPMVAASRGISFVRHGWGLAITPEADYFAAEQLADELKRLGLDGFPAPDMELDVWPASLQLPVSTATVRVRHTPFSGARAAVPQLLERGSRPRVCLTLGTTVPRVHGPELLLRLQRTLPALGIEVVIAISDQLARELDPPGGDVLAVSWQPLALVMPNCDLVIHQGGAGTTLTSLASGLPQVILPHMGDQFDNAERMADSGAAIRIPRREAAPEAVMAAVAAIMGDRTFGERAWDLRDEMRRQPTPVMVASRIEALPGTSLR